MKKLLTAFLIVFAYSLAAAQQRQASGPLTIDEALQFPRINRSAVESNFSRFSELISQAAKEPDIFYNVAVYPVTANETPSCLIPIEPSDSLPSVTIKRNLQVKDVVKEPLKEMFRAAESQGLKLAIRDAYRCYREQCCLSRKLPGTASKAGHSEHGIGCAVDINSCRGNLPPNGPEAKWLYANSESFGFVRTVSGESWHFRYIGSEGVELYRKYFNNNLQAMLEFIDKYKDQLQLTAEARERLAFVKTPAQNPSGFFANSAPKTSGATAKKIQKSGIKISSGFKN